MRVDELRVKTIPPTPKQINYMQILFADTGFTLNSRNAWLTHKYKRLINHLDELTFKEGQEVITQLKEIRGDKN